MVRQRPAAVLVMAILNLVFGGLGALGLLCGAVSLAIVSNLPTQQAGNPFLKNFKDFEIPGYTAYVVVSLVFGLFTTIALIASGIGLLRMRPWARQLAIAYGVVVILFQIAGLVIQLVYINPAAVELEAQQPPPPKVQNVPQFNMGDSSFRTATAIGGAVLGVAYPIALLIVMCLPGVSAAFAGKAGPSREDPDDYYDDRPNEGAFRPQT